MRIRRLILNHQTQNAQPYFSSRYETKIHSSISYPRVAQTPDPTDSVRSQSFRFNHTSGSCSAHFKGRQKMTIHLDNNEAHLLQTMLKVELMRATSVSYAKEIKPLADCIEGLLDKLQPKHKMEIRIKRISEEVARNIDERMRRQGIL